MNAGAQFEIIVDGKPHTYRDLREMAIDRHHSKDRMTPSRRITNV